MDVSNLTVIEQILKVPPLQRTSKQLKKLAEFLAGLSFFKNLIGNVTDDILLKASEFVLYEFFREGEFVVHFGEPGDKFYIILHGEVRVLIPNGKEEEDGEVEENMREVNLLGSGSSFGEYALLYNQNRLASIQCCKDTHLAMFSKEGYIRILGKIESKRIDESVKMLRMFQIFRNWTKNPIVKINYFFSERVVSRKTVLFKEGTNINEVFFVKQGEVELLKAVEVESPDKSGFKKKPRKQNINVSILSSGEMINTEVLTSEKYLYTCQVYSFTAKILVISKSHFCSKLKNEETQNLMKKNSESKENERKKRVGSLEKFRNFNIDPIETEKIHRPHIKPLTRSPKYHSESPKQHKSSNLSENHLKRIISRSRIDITSGENTLISSKLADLKSIPRNYSIFQRHAIKKYMYPIRIEQKQLIDRFRTPDIINNRQFYL